MRKENKEILKVFVGIWLFLFFILLIVMIGYETYHVYPNLNEFRYVNVILSVFITNSILGSLIATRQIFSIYVPALMLTFLTRDREQQQKYDRIKIALTVSALILGFLSPLVLTQLIVPEYVPMKFQFFRLAESPKMAFSGPPPWQTGNLILLYFQNSLLPSLGLSFLFVPILIAIFRVHAPFLQKSRIDNHFSSWRSCVLHFCFPSQHRPYVSQLLFSPTSFFDSCFCDKLCFKEGTEESCDWAYNLLPNFVCLFHLGDPELLRYRL